MTTLVRKKFSCKCAGSECVFTFCAEEFLKNPDLKRFYHCPVTGNIMPVGIPASKKYIDVK